jgi:hypothetical protein
VEKEENFSILLISSAYATLIPSAHAADITVQQKGLTILNNVVGLYMANYSTVLTECPKDSYLGVVPQENVRYTLESNGSKVDALYTFANGNLRMLYVLESQGSPQLTKSATKPIQLGNATLQVVDILETAKSFLNNYTSYSGKSFYGNLASMLENVNANQNSTKTAGNVKLEVNASQGSTVFRWTYTFNGIEAPDKCVAIGYQNGFLKYFIDNWDLYKIGSTTINLSEEEAISIAMERASSLSLTVDSGNETCEVKKYNVTNAMIWETLFCSNLYADKPRSEDPLMLYPVRHVWVSLDKFYPGNVYGIEVYVWADTKDIAHLQERFSTLDPPADQLATINYSIGDQPTGKISVNETKTNLIAPEWMALPALAMVTMGSYSVWLVKKKHLPRRFVKIGGLLLCFLAFWIFLFPVLTVDAEPTRRATIWGSESHGAYDDRISGSWKYWRKTEAEVNRQVTTSNAISNYFRDDGYNTGNYQGSSGSYKNQIIATIEDSEANYTNVAVVDFDHGIYGTDYPAARQGERHYRFEDQEGTWHGPWREDGKYETHHENAVYDMDIASKTTAGKTFFALINTCLSANIEIQGPNNGQPQGMPYAWTHRTVVDKDTPGFTTSLNMSINGYNEPDGGAFCYIGFPWGSAALSQTITGISPLYATWLENFFWYALSFDISVNNALDEASLRNFNNLFGDTDLATGFTAVWPSWNATHGWHDNTGPGTLAVYGNGNIHLYEYFVHDYVDAAWYGYYAGVDNPDGIEGGSNDDSYAHLYAAGWYGDQAVITGSIGWEAKGHIYLYGNTYSGYNSHVEVWVSYDYSNWDLVNEDLWISETSPGWIDVGSYASNFRYIAVVVYADQAPSVLYVDSVLVIPQPQQFSPHYWVASVVSTTTYAYGQIHNPTGLNHSYNDGSYVQLYGGNYGDGAGIVGAMSGDAHGHIYLYGYSAAGYYTHMYVYVSYNNYNDWTEITRQTVYPSSAGWIDCNYYGGNFRYIKIVAIDDNGMSACLNLDSVRVVP